VSAFYTYRLRLVLVVFLAIFSVAGFPVWPVEAAENARKMVLAASAEELAVLGDIGRSAIELAGPRFHSWPVVIVNDEGLKLLTAADVPFVVLDDDLTRNLRSLGSDMGKYHTYEETVEELVRLQAEYPELMMVQSIGQSIQQRDLLAAIVSGADWQDSSLGTCLLVGLHHAREIISTEVVLYALNYVLAQYGTDPDITYLLNHRRVIFVPMLNPDGHVRVEGGTDWRKNMRDNLDGTFGVDLNRNYSYMWGYDDIGSSPQTWVETYRGVGPFSEPETQAIRSLREEMGYDVSLSFHSIGDIIYYPWAYCDARSPDHMLQARFASIISSASGYTYGDTAVHSCSPANGEFDDWNYAGLGLDKKVFGLTFEVGDAFYEREDRVDELCGQNLQSCIQAIRASGPWIDVLQSAIVEEEPDGVLRAGESFTLKLSLQLLSVKQTGPVEVSCVSDSPLVSIVSPTINFESMAPLARLSDGECSFDAVAVLGEELPQVVPLTIDVEAQGFHRQVQVKVPIGLDMTETAASWDFESDEGFKASGGWERGEPKGNGGAVNGGPGPATACSGQKVYGTNLSGDVSGPDERFFLTSPAFSCEGFCCTRLSFERWMNVGAADQYRAAVSVLADGQWHDAWYSLGRVCDTQWHAVSLDISRWADGRRDVRVRFSLLANSSDAYSGLYLDDVAVTGCHALASRMQRVILPLVFGSSDGRLDTIMVIQNRSNGPRPTQVVFTSQDGRRRLSSAIVESEGFTVLSGSVEAGVGLWSAAFSCSKLTDFNFSAFLVDLNSLGFCSIDLMPEETRSVDLHFYYTDVDTESLLVLSNNSSVQDVMNIDILARGPDGGWVGSLGRRLSPGEVQLVPLSDSFGPGLAVLSVKSDKPGLGACGIITLGDGSRLQVMKSFYGN